MVHTLVKGNSKIEIHKSEHSILIRTISKDSFADIELDKENLHDFIGILLHLQSKIKK